MRKSLAGILLAAAIAFALAGCGGGESALQQADQELQALVEGGSPALSTRYDAGTDTLVVALDQGADLDAVFDALNGAIDEKEAGTLVFTLDGTKGDGFEDQIDGKIAQLSCASLQRLGLNYYIAQAQTHAWTELSAKTTALYLDSPPSVLYDCTDEEMKNLAGFTDVQLVYEPDMRFGGVQLLSGAATLSLVKTITPDEDEADGSQAEENADSDTETEETAEEETPQPETLSYNEGLSKGIEDIALMPDLEAVLFYPATGYTPDENGELLIRSLELLKPEVKINVPGKAYEGEEDLVAVKKVETPAVTSEVKDELLCGFLKDEVKGVYEGCEKYEEASGEAVLSGKCLVYHGDPGQDYWSDEEKYYSGKVLVAEAAEHGISVPESVGDYQTFVYIYPTYERTGTYTGGTGAYRQTLHVQVFDLKGKTAYKSETVGSAEAPSSFTYVGSTPDKHSGEVNLDKAFDYLKGLKKQ